MSYTYDTLNRLTNPTSLWAGAFSFGYDNLSRRTSLMRPNSINTEYQYDSLSRLLFVLHKSGSTIVDGAAYMLDDCRHPLTASERLPARRVVPLS